MQIQIASDLHLEFLQQDWPCELIIKPAEADVLVLAGDIASSTEAFRLFQDWPTPVIYVAGNHEFYGGAYAPRINKMRAKSAPKTNIHFLENDTAIIGDTRFIGCILWTDYNLYSTASQASQMTYAQNHLNDHELIRIGRRKFAAQDALNRHEFSREWLKRELAKSWPGRTVVVTHHGPHPLSVHPKYADDMLTAAFVSDLSEILVSDHAPDLWIHGHVHDSFDYAVGRTRVLANPAGYLLNRRTAKDPSEFRFENPAFDSRMKVEVDDPADRLRWCRASDLR